MILEHETVVQQRYALEKSRSETKSGGKDPKNRQFIKFVCLLVFFAE
jgi:hypothetical protein